MPRKRQDNYARATRLVGKISGVTFQTNPSGTTIYKATVDTTNLNATTGTITTLATSNITNSGGAGYALPYLSATGKLLATGKIANPSGGVTKVEASFFGMTAVNFCMATVGTTNVQSQAASAQVVVTTSKGSIFPTAGVSRVYFRAFQGTGTAWSRPSSIQYFAIGV